MASYVITLAKLTGWDEDYILNVLPMSRYLQYRHCCLRSEGYWTVPPSAPASEQLEELRRRRQASPALPVLERKSADKIPPRQTWSDRLRELSVKS